MFFAMDNCGLLLCGIVGLLWFFLFKEHQVERDESEMGWDHCIVEMDVVLVMQCSALKIGNVYCAVVIILTQLLIFYFNWTSHTELPPSFSLSICG